MANDISLVKGIHPGVILERELKKRKLAKSRFALSLQEYPQVLGEITKGKRKMNIPLALKIESALGFEEGYLMMLQLFFDIKQEKQKLNKAVHPDLSKFRPVLFWDTKMDKIDWVTQKSAIIKRVLERGNDQEKEELERFYGKDTLSIEY
jgi:plasmid maintenance system antidote protein VapI